ncbi:MAG TPA: SAM-dependent methyltransferase [Desulfobacteraceae bacterium]|nr:SAM-dependent methyltransferase [Desulfobacteraceae bacterium]
MNSNIPDTLATVEFQSDWKNESASHTDIFYADRINFWRDIFPPQLYKALIYRCIGDSAEIEFTPGEVIPVYDDRKLFQIRNSQFEKKIRSDAFINPRPGRFYPKGLLKDIANVFKENIVPFRCTKVADSEIQVDFNHPLAGKAFQLRTLICDVKNKHSDRGGSLTDWIDAITDGPGMQARWKGQPTDFFSDDPFRRSDETPDGHFYEKPRFVNHLDDTAIAHIRNLYGRLIKPKSRVLDLMSSWTSHLPANLELPQLTGLGLNAEELKQNERLTEYVAHDLNENPILPFEDGHYDAVICTVSAEYMIRPFDVFAETARILKPGGVFILSFSNRWFAPKVIRIWQEIHEFERMGLVTEYFLQTGKFEKISTLSIRGYPRPETDKYYSQQFFSDPVFAVWGTKRL